MRPRGFASFCPLITRLLSRFFKAPLPATRYPAEWVDTPDALDRAVKAVRGSKIIYFDLEADSMHHYHAKICLMQILAKGRCWLVDPLADIDVRPLRAALAEKPLIGHGLDYDLRMLRHHGFKPVSIFDTMLAAQLLGKSAFGLAALIQDNFGVVIPKEGQKADWSRRPLARDLVEYAAQDTFYLPALHGILTRELQAKGRLDWHRESCDALIRATQRQRETDREDAWRITGSNKFRPRQLAVLKAMWEVREHAASERDLPSFKVLPADLLLRFAECVPAEGFPEDVPKLPSRLSPHLRDDLLEAFEDALESPSEAWPGLPPPPKRPPRAPHPELLIDMKEIRDGIAAKLGLDPSLLAPKAVMMAVAISGLSSPEAVREAAQWMKWQEGLLLEPWMKAAGRYRKRR
jgi:ribonuclease D